LPDYISIGKIAAVHGVKGEMILQHVLGKKTSLKGVKAVFTQDKSASWFPWFVKEAKAKNKQEILLSLEEVDTPEAAKKLLQKTIWLVESDAAQHAAPASVLAIVNYTVINNGVALGEIVEVVEQPHQLLCTIMVNGKEVLIPLHQESLLNIDRNKRQVFVDLPDGLLELYL
jgi:16S rRNA processing protein RimM